MPTTFANGCVLLLQQSPAVSSAFGYPVAPNAFSSDFGSETPQPPYAIIRRMGSSYDYQSIDFSGGVAQYEHCMLQVSIFSTPSQNIEALGELVMQCLQDGPVYYDQGSCLEIRLIGEVDIPEPDITTASPVVYHRAQTYLCKLQRSLKATLANS